MLDHTIKKKLESLNELPTIPYVISEVLSAVENTNLSATHLANLIQRDQSLTTRVLRVANSPFYGFSRRISTIELAVVVLGWNTIKEIVLSIILQRFFLTVSRKIFDVEKFWHYSVFCGSASRVLARKFGYRISGEAFIAGLIHDVGILVLAEYFTNDFMTIRNLMRRQNFSLTQAEEIILKCNHCDIGNWFAERWNLPGQLCETIQYHHSNYIDYKISKKNKSENGSTTVTNEEENEDDVTGKELLIAIVALSEWFAGQLGFMVWAGEQHQTNLFLVKELLEDVGQDDLLNPESAIEVLKQDILAEYEKAAIINAMIAM
jgi:HD-like signal output (HDOD) protein